MKLLRKSIKPPVVDPESRLKSIQRLSQPRKIPLPDLPEKIIEPKRPINMEAILRLAMPRKIPKPEPMHAFARRRSIQGDEYYEKLSQPRKIKEEINARDLEPKLTSMARTQEMSVPLKRLQRRKFMKGDNDEKFPISKAALQYKATAKINKLAIPREHPEESQGKGKSKRRK